MRIPEVLEPLFDQGVIQDVVRPLMAGKEAQIYLVVSNGRYAAAKCYKDSAHRSFKQRATYTEGRKVRGSREQRAIDRGSKSPSRSTPSDARSVENNSRLSNRSGSPVKNVSASGEPDDPTSTFAASTQRHRAARARMALSMACVVGL